MDPHASARRSPTQPKPRREFLAGLSVGLVLVAAGVAGFLWIELTDHAAISMAAATIETPNVAATAAPKAPRQFVRELTESEIAALTKPAVVTVENLDATGKRAAEGSGYLYSADGIVVTNYHSIQAAASILVKVPSKGTMRVEQLLGFSAERDLALLQLPDRAGALLPTAADDSTVKPGDAVFAVTALAPGVRHGVVSAVTQVSGVRIVETEEEIDPGQEGGPLLNEFGSVIGFTAPKIQGATNLNWAISSREIAAMIAEKRAISLAQIVFFAR